LIVSLINLVGTNWATFQSSFDLFYFNSLTLLKQK
jgi:hypothetical protein